MTQRIARLARHLEVLTLLALLFLPLAVLCSVANGLADPEAIRARFADLDIAGPIPPGKAAATAALGLLALIPAMAALCDMRALFALYRQGEILTDAAAERIRRIGAALVVLAAAGTLLHTVQALLLTADNPAGQRQLVLSLSSDSIGFLLSGGLLILIGWAMREAARAAAENAGFV